MENLRGTCMFLSYHVKIYVKVHNVTFHLVSPSPPPPTPLSHIKDPQHFIPAGARAARERLVLRLLYVLRICLFDCLFTMADLHYSKNSN